MATEKNEEEEDNVRQSLIKMQRGTAIADVKYKRRKLSPVIEAALHAQREGKGGEVIPLPETPREPK